jgi:hypothetical protein
VRLPAERSFPARPKAVRRGVHRWAGRRRRGPVSVRRCREAASVHRRVAAAVAAWFRQQAELPLAVRPAEVSSEFAALAQAAAWRPKGAAAVVAQQSAASEQRARASLRAAAAESGVRCAQAAPRPAASATGYGPAAAEVAASDAEVLPPEVAAVPDGQQAAAGAGAAEPDARQVAVAEEEPDAPRAVAVAAAEPGAEAVLRPGAAAQDVPVRQPAAARPSAGPLAFRRDRVLLSAP